MSQPDEEDKLVLAKLEDEVEENEIPPVTEALALSYKLMTLVEKKQNDEAWATWRKIMALDEELGRYVQAFMPGGTPKDL